MMTTKRVLLVIGILLALNAAVVRADVAEAVSSADAVAPTMAPPERPLQITAEQLGALERLAATPEYAVAAETRAAYSPSAQEVASEVGAAGIYGAWFGIVGFILLTAV